jgi:GntR family transcriptional regulator, galactonate operon transcriptional repressor
MVVMQGENLAEKCQTPNFKVEPVQRFVRSDRLYMRVVNNLAYQILRAGSEILVFPAEPELCRMLGVSRTALREAVKVLEAKGMVEVSHGQGMMARRRQDWNHLDPDVLNWQCEYGADELFLRNLVEIREIIEPMAAALTAERAEDDRIARVKACYLQLEEHVHDSEAYIQADLAFHNEIIAACGNDVLSKMAQSIGTALHASRKISIQVPGGWAKSLPLHAALADAIAQRDATGARAATTVIIRAAARDIRAVIKTQSVPDSPTRPQELKPSGHPATYLSSISAGNPPE